MRKNILLLILVLVLCLVVASYFGALYDKFSPQYSYGLFGVGRENAIIFAGIPFAYMFLIPFVFGMFGAGKKRKWILWSLLPVVLFYLYDSVSLIYIPIVAGLAGFLFATLINLLISKFKHPNPQIN